MEEVRPTPVDKVNDDPPVFQLVSPSGGGSCIVNVSLNDDVTKAIMNTMFLEYIHLYLCLSGC